MDQNEIDGVHKYANVKSKKTRKHHFKGCAQIQRKHKQKKTTTTNF